MCRDKDGAKSEGMANQWTAVILKVKHAPEADMRIESQFYFT